MKVYWVEWHRGSGEIWLSPCGRHWDPLKVYDQSPQYFHALGNNSPKSYWHDKDNIFHPFFKSGFKLRKMDLGFPCDLFPCIRQMRGCHQGLVEKSKEILPEAQEHRLVFILAAVPFIPFKPSAPVVSHPLLHPPSPPRQILTGL